VATCRPGRTPAPIGPKAYLPRLRWR
jgi:hypothetical protein